VTPAVLGLAAAVGHDELLVADHVAVDLFVLGDELIQEGVPSAGRTRDALGVQLPGWIHGLGGCPTAPVHLRDDPKRLISALSGSNARLVVTTGGTSVGRRDHVRSAVRAMRGRLLVDGVQVKPGHPMLLAELDRGRILMGLPGNPLAACVALMTLAQPLLGALTGSPRSPVPRDTVVLTADEAPRKSDVHRLLPARRSPDGLATVLPSCGSAMLRGLAQADGLLVLPPGGGRAGDSVAFLRLPWDADTGGC
jgi:molybdopterin molybdotransferase